MTSEMDEVTVKIAFLSATLKYRLRLKNEFRHNDEHLEKARALQLAWSKLEAKQIAPSWLVDIA